MQIVQSLPLNQILCGDAVETMKSWPDSCVDLVITSPPYNLKNSTGNGMKDGRGGKWANARLQDGYSHHHDNMPHEDYVQWQREALTEMCRLLTDDGAIFYNHKWRVQAGLVRVADELRAETVSAVSVTGGHLGAGLGVVELTVAIHYVFNTPEDRLVWDVGHQSYPHKILTGRREAMATLKQLGGISGFPRRSESEYDTFGTGHSSTSISAALGVPVAVRMPMIKLRNEAR